MLPVPKGSPSPTQMRQVTDGAASAALLPHIQQETEAMERTIITRTTMALRDGKLTPEAALEAWRELAATRRLLKSFQTRVTIGAGVADEIADQLKL